MLILIMSNTTIRIITALVGLIVLIFIAGGLYLFFVGQNNPSTTEDSSESLLRRTFVPLFTNDEDDPAVVPTPTATTSIQVADDRTRVVPPLFQVWDQPVAGARIVSASSSDFVRLVDRTTGHIFDVSLQDGSVARVTNTTLPKIQNVVWISDSELIIQYINPEDEETIQTFAARIEFPENTSTSTTPIVGTLEGTFLPTGIDAVAAYAGSYAYIKNGSLVYNNTTLFTSPLSGWQLDWVNETTLVMTLNASSETTGVAYEITTNGSVAVLVPPTESLTLNANNNTLLIGQGINLTIQSFNDREIITQLNQSTLPEKCVWGRKNTLFCGVPNRQSLIGTIPDDWYQGALVFTDSLWDVTTGGGQQILSPTQQFDIIPLDTTPTESRILFHDRITDTVWVLTQ